jgi:hypothetical protein
MNELLLNNDYKNWLIELKSKIQHNQIKAALAVNSQLIQLYWDLGKQITFELKKILPNELESRLPSIEEIENKLKKNIDAITIEK